MAGSNPQMIIRIAANVEELKKNLAEGKASVEALGPSVEKMTANWTASSAKLIQNAANITAAVTKVGASTLTTGQASQAVKTLDAAMAQLARTSQPIPPAMTRIAEELHKVANEGKNAKESTGSLFETLTGSVAAGSVIASAIEKIASTVTHLAKESVDWIAEITMAGSKELGIEKAFKRLTGQVGLDAKVVLEDLREATHYTVEEFDLMKRVNENLAAGMNLTEDQYKTLAAGAFALAKATGVDVKDAFDTMSDAMLTGRMRAVALLTGKIDATKAEEDFAKSLGKTRDELTSEGKIEAARVAIVEKVGGAIVRLGDQTDGLGTKVKQAKVWWSDFQDELGKAIASSPPLMTAIGSIGDVLTETFGVAREYAVQRLALAIDQVAISTVELAANVAPAIGIIGTEFNALQVVARNVLQFLDLMLLGIKQIALAGVEAIDDVMPGAQLREQQIRLRTDIAALRVEMVARARAMDEDKRAEDEWWNVGQRLQTQLVALQAKMEASRRTISEHAKAVHETGEAANYSSDRFINTGQAAEEHAKKLKSLMETGDALATGFQTMFARGESASEMFKALGSKASGLQVAFDELGEKVPARFAWIVETFHDMGAQIEQDKTIDAAMKAIDDQMRKALDDIVKNAEAIASKQRDVENKAVTDNLTAQIKANDDRLKLEGDSLDKRLEVVRREMQVRRDALKEGTLGYQDALDEINVLEAESARQATEAWLDHVAELKRAMGPSFLDIFKNALKGIPEIMKAAFTGGGGVAGAFSAVVSDLGSALGTKLGGMLANALSGTLGKLGAKVGGAIFDMIPGIGGMLGAAVEPLMNKLFKTEGKKVNDLRDEFIAAQGGFVALHQKLIDAGADSAYFALQNAKNLKEWEAAQKAVTAALDAYNAKLAEEKQLKDDIASTEAEIASLEAQLVPTWQQVSGIIEKYKINVDALGQSVQKLRLTDVATTIVSDWETMQRAGAEMGIVAEGMKDQINKVVQEAEKFGVDLPANMQPAIEKMIELGLLVDENGEKITDISGIKFGAPVKTEADKIKDAIVALTDKLQVFIDKLAKLTGVADDVASDVNNSFRKAPWEDWPPPEFPVVPGGPDAETYASGGVVYASSGWRVRGSDIVPAMLTPGERVLTVGQNYDYERQQASRTSSPDTTPISISIYAMDPVGLKRVVEQDIVPLLVSAYRRNVNGARTNTRKELVE